MSGNLITIQSAWHNKIKPSGRVPLATDLSFLTNKFWFKLNKGFGTNTFPKIFDIITRAQILLSSQINKSVSNKFEELKQGFESGSLKKELVPLIIAKLREEIKNPEDINNNLPSILNSISESSIEKIVQGQEYLKHNAKQQEEENIKLRKELEKKQILNNEISREKKIILERERRKETVINDIKVKIEIECCRKWSRVIDYSLWIIWGILLSIIFFRWYYLKIHLYILFFIIFIIACIFVELRFEKKILFWLPQKFTEWIPKYLDFPKIRSNIEEKLIKKCIIKKGRDIGLDN